MIPMLATIDDTTARKVDEDRKIHGVGYLRVNADGSAEHVPIGDIQVRADLELSTGHDWTARL